MPTLPVCGRASYRSTTPGRSTRRGSRRRARTRARKSGQVGPLGERAGGPGVPEHRRHVGTEHVHRASAATGRTAVCHQSSGERRGQPGVSGQLVAGPEPARLPHHRHWYVGGDEVLGQQPGRDPQQLVVRQRGGVHGRRAEPPRLVDPDELEIRAAAARRGRGEHPLDQSRTRAAGEVEAAQQLQLLGAGQEPAVLGRVRRRPVAPRRRTAPAQVRDPGPGAGPAGVDRGWLIGAGAEPAWRRGTSGCRRGRARRAASRMVATSASRAAEETSRGRGRSGSCHSASGAGRTGRSSSRSPTTSTPAPLTHSIQPCATSSAHSCASGGSVTGRIRSRSARVSWTTS